jgi:osmotically inducible protein OsmC
MKITRKATAEWKGSGKEGKGTVTTDSKVLDGTQYGFTSRFEDGKGTNPEELIGAAHAGCFSMKLAFNLQEEGITADSINTESKVILEDDGINTIKLSTRVKVSGLDQSKFDELANDAKENCPISALFKANIEFEATLEN